MNYYEEIIYLAVKSISHGTHNTKLWSMSQGYSWH